MSLIAKKTTQLVLRNAHLITRSLASTSNSSHIKLNLSNRPVLNSLPTLSASLTKTKINGLSVRNYGHVPYTKDMIEQRVLLVLNLCDKIDPSKLSLKSNFVKDLGLDSLDHVDLIIAMEDEFGFEIPDEDSEFLNTPKDVVQYVCDKFDVFH